jgi:histidine triad (HIT) family protein
MEDCLFCKIGNKSVPANVVYEDAHSVGILDINPKAPGHTMIIPKEHRETILDASEEELGPLFSSVKSVVEILQQVLSAEGFTIGINQGDAAGQTVKHLHIHVIPRFRNDQGGSIHSVVNNPPQESREEIAEKIKKVSQK